MVLAINPVMLSSPEATVVLVSDSAPLRSLHEHGTTLVFFVVVVSWALNSALQRNKGGLTL